MIGFDKEVARTHPGPVLTVADVRATGIVILGYVELIPTMLRAQQV